MKHKHPLEKAFDMADEYLDESMSEFEIPTHPTLDTIIGFALTAYKDQMDVMMLVEPKNRIKYMEIAEKFLGQAKDAMTKKENLQIQRDKIIPPKRSAQGAIEGEFEEEQTVSRTELLERLAQEKRNNTNNI